MWEIWTNERQPFIWQKKKKKRKLPYKCRKPKRQLSPGKPNGKALCSPGLSNVKEKREMRKQSLPKSIAFLNRYKYHSIWICWSFHLKTCSLWEKWLPLFSQTCFLWNNTKWSSTMLSSLFFFFLINEKCNQLFSVFWQKFIYDTIECCCCTRKPLKDSPWTVSSSSLATNLAARTTVCRWKVTALISGGQEERQTARIPLTSTNPGKGALGPVARSFAQGNRVLVFPRWKTGELVKRVS